MMVLASYIFVSDIVRKQIFNYAREMLQSAEASIHSDFRESEVILFNTSNFIQRGLDLGWTNNDIREYLVWRYQVAVSGEVNIPGFFDIFCYRDGELISGGSYNLPTGANFVPRSRPWYGSAIEARGGVGYSPLYEDIVTGRKVVSLTRTMGSEDRRWYAGEDIALEPLFRLVNALQSSEGGYGLIADHNFSLLVHPNSEFIGRPMDELSPSHAEFVQNLREHPDTVVVQEMSNWKGNRMVLVSKQLFNGWYLAIATPAANYYRDVRFMAIMLSLLGFVFMTMLSIFLVRLNVLRVRSDEESRSKTSFLARMSHEIRTPMNTILGMAELIQRKGISDEVREYVNILHNSGQNLLEIINDILDLSRIESNRLQIEKRPYYIASVINDVVNMVRPRAAEKSLDFFVRVDSAVPNQLLGDDGRLRQILTNLLTNAVKYTRRGFISLSVQTSAFEGSAAALIFSVEDSGIGIRQEDMGRLFSDFSRLDAQVNQGIEGTGLGLAITRALCRAMGGDVIVSSEYGRGSVFRASLIQEIGDKKPAARVDKPREKRAIFFDDRPRYVQSIMDAFTGLGVNVTSAAGLVEFLKALEHGDYDCAFVSSRYALDSIYAQGKRNDPMRLVIMIELGEMSVFREVNTIMMPVYSITVAGAINDKQSSGTPIKSAKLKINFSAPEAKILIVDDISTNLLVARELMSPYGMQVHTCLSGAEAVELIKQDRYDAVFMDHMMPGMDGLEATALIRSMEDGSGYFRKLPIIALTANAVAGQREMFLEKGIDDFLAKPIDIQKLNDILEKWLPAEKRTQAMPRREEAVPEKTEIAAVAGLDTEAGLRNIGGSVPVYFDILLNFCRDSESREVDIAEALKAGDMKLYVTLVHALKGAARGIGALDLGEAAARLEAEGGLAKPAELRQKTTELLENLRILTKNIKTAAARREAGDSRKRVDLSALNLDALKTALAEMDVEAVNKILLDYAGLSLDSGLRAKIAELEEQILLFEYDKAIEKINTLFREQ
jgi:signal transduction histidine kinase/DNA-binding NarL/FixJ family response regulator